MSNYRYRWYYYIKKEIMFINKPNKIETSQNTKLREAYDKAVEETLKLPKGDLRMRAVNDILIKQTKTCEGMAQELYYDRSTVARWINAFVILVGKEAGY